MVNNTQYIKSIIVIGVLQLFTTHIRIGFADGNKVVLLTTEGATTDFNWQVENLNDPPGYRGWEDTSMHYKDQVLRSYQICEIYRTYKDAEKPESWLLLPKVNVNGTSRVYIEMNFTMRECSDLQKPCRETFSVHYRTSNKQYDEIDFHPKLFKKLDTVAAEVRFSADVNDTRMNHETVDISFPSALQHAYLQIAIVDAGACVALMGIRVYYKVCRENVTGFATFRETKTGVNDTSLVPVVGSCIPHSLYTDPTPPMISHEKTTASNMLSGPLFHCTSSGIWQVNTGSCTCVAGYEPNTAKTQCRPCMKGLYKPSIGNNPCLRCPDNSATVMDGATTCHCNSGYSAIRNRKPRLSSNDCELCTKLPGSPESLSASTEDVNEPGSVTLSWKRPADRGGCRAILYQIFCNHVPPVSIADNLKTDGYCSHADYFPSSRELKSQKVTVKNLRGHSSYNFTVLAYTLSTVAGMSEELSNLVFGGNSKDASNITTRFHSWYQNQELAKLLSHSSSHVAYRTSDTIPSSVRDVVTIKKNETAIAVTWKRPAFPNGDILFYLVRYALDYDRSSDPHHTNTAYESEQYELSWLRTKTNKTEVTLSDLSPGSTYQIVVSVHNSAGSDNGSSPLLATTLPVSQQPQGGAEDPSTFPYIIATIVVAGLVIVVGIALLLHWKCKSHQEKDDHRNGDVEGPAQFRPYNSQHDTIDQRTYVDPFCLKSLPKHQFLCEISPESITIDKVIGRGEFGEVYSGTLATIDIKTGQETVIDVAVKRLKNQCKPEEQKSFFQEAQALEKFRHPNIVHLEAVVTLTRPFIIVTEMMSNGSLQGFLMKLKAKAETEQNENSLRYPIPPQTIVNMLRGVASGMEYLSGRGYVHRDLAARNVLVSSDMICKVADFGLLREFDKNEADQENGVYTTSGGKIAIKWTAPEAITYRTFTQFSDVWSFGILIWEAASYGEKPYWAYTNDEVITAVNQGMRLPAPDRCPAVLHQLMLKCWQRDHHSRPTFTKIIAELVWMLDDPNTLNLPASPASCGHPEMLFGDEAIVVDEADPPRDTESLLGSENDIQEHPLANSLRLDLSNLNSDSEIEHSDSDDDTIGSHTPDEEGSEVSSCTSTICASEITVCAANGSAAYVPLLRSEFGSDDEQSSRSSTPTGRYYSLHR